LLVQRELRKFYVFRVHWLLEVIGLLILLSWYFPGELFGTRRGKRVEGELMSDLLEAILLIFISKEYRVWWSCPRSEENFRSFMFSGYTLNYRERERGRVKIYEKPYLILCINLYLREYKVLVIWSLIRRELLKFYNFWVHRYITEIKREGGGVEKDNRIHEKPYLIFSVNFLSEGT